LIDRFVIIGIIIIVVVVVVVIVVVYVVGEQQARAPVQRGSV
jgi:uncharacterized protein YpmB